MPTESTNSAFPAALDHLPTIQPNDSEQAAGIEHDVMHDMANGAINALQALVGIDGTTDPDTIRGAVAALASSKLDADAVGDTVASLVSGKVPSAQLPSYVDDVIEVADEAALPATGETGKIYITIDTGAQYRWSGSTYVQLTSSPGTTDAVPEGTTNLYFTDARAYAVVKASLQAGTHSGVSFAFDDGTLAISVSASSGSGGDLRDTWLMG